MRKKLVSCALLLFMLFFCGFSVRAAGKTVSVPPASPCDVGNHVDYDDDDDDGGYYGGYTDNDDDDDDGGYTGHNYGGGTYYDENIIYSVFSNKGQVTMIGVIIFIAFVIVMIIYCIYKISTDKNTTYTPPENRRNAPAPAPARKEPPRVPDCTYEILCAIQETDPQFNRQNFVEWSKMVFVTLQAAWTARDWNRVRSFESEDLFRMHKTQLQEYIDNNQINMVERVNVNRSYFYQYVREREYEYLTVYLEARLNDYIIDASTRRVVRGDPKKEHHMQYLLTYKRRFGVQTNPSLSNKSTISCPSCGAPIKLRGAACEYCGSVITTGEYDWVLSNLDSVRPGMSLSKSGVQIHTD